MKKIFKNIIFSTLIVTTLLTGAVALSKGNSCSQWDGSREHVGLTDLLDEWGFNKGYDAKLNYTYTVPQVPGRYMPALQAINGAISALGLANCTKNNVWCSMPNEAAWFGITNDVVESAFVQAGGDYSMGIRVPSADVQRKMRAILDPIALANAQAHLNGTAVTPKTTATKYKYGFDPVYYAAANPDVVACPDFGLDPDKLYQHYIKHGRKEGRPAHL